MADTAPNTTASDQNGSQKRAERKGRGSLNPAKRSVGLAGAITGDVADFLGGKKNPVGGTVQAVAKGLDKAAGKGINKQQDDSPTASSVFAVVTQISPQDDEADSPWPPTILVLEGQSIYAESSDTVPLFQLNRGVVNPGRATTELELERVKYGVRRSRPETPTMKKPRLRHVYNLKYMNRAPGGLDSLPSNSPHYHIQSTSQQTLGHIGLKRWHVRSRYSALPLDMSERGDYGIPQFEWVDSEGKATAIQEEWDDQHKLLVTAELSSDSMTTLVALWCCRVWEDSVANVDKVDGGLDGVRRKFKLATDAPRTATTRSLIG
ncbi:hypothetical protein PG997_007300 [Apiospora hydei]|uniref:Uncharacterized protein n=1 Tax=Apiospora hydei TaxID=1337664 RepID=A0ABR1W7U8_9PEZI